LAGDASISNAVGSTVTYVDVTPEDKRQEWLDRGYPPERADAFLQAFAERKRLGHSSVDLSAHERFGIPATTFDAFAAKNVEVFRGVAAFTTTPA
jgi:hypothetical protein